MHCLSYTILLTNNVILAIIVTGLMGCGFAKTDQNVTITEYILFSPYAMIK